MAQRTYDSTPVREVGLSAAVAAANVDVVAQNSALAAQDPPGTPLPLWTNDTYWAARVDAVLDSYAVQHQKDIAVRAVQAFEAASDENRQQLLAMLGLTDYASLPPTALVAVLSTLGLANFQALPPDQQNQALTLAGLTA